MNERVNRARHAKRQDMPHKNLLSRRVGTAFLSGCLAVSLCPAIALAQPDIATGDQQGGKPPAQQQAPQDQGQKSFGGWDQLGFQMNGNDAPTAPQGESEQPPAAPEEGSQQGKSQQPGGGQQPSNGQQPDGSQLPPDEDGGRAPDANGMPGSNNGNNPGPRMQQEQMSSVPGAMQQMAGAPDQMRSLVERVLDFVGVEHDSPFIEQIMGKLVNLAPSGQQGQQGQAPGQAGQLGQQPSAGNQGDQQPGQQGRQPGQPNQQGQPGQLGGANEAPTSFDAANKLTGDSADTSYESVSNNQNAILVDGKSLSLSGITVSKTGNADGESADFYGTNAAILANNGATLSITGADISSDGSHANGVFSYGTGTTVNVADSTIITRGNNSGGLMATGGAALNATNLTVSTSGNSSAAIRTDRGGGTVTVTEGTYSTSGVGSPAVYSTADVTVSDASLSATNSEAIVIEGGNSVTLGNVNATGNNAKLNGQSTVKTNVLIYQSMSGDAAEGSSEFNMTGGSLTSLSGSMFHVTNATTTINLSGVTLVGADDSDDFLIATADSWGTKGKNGGNATINLSGQDAKGNITVDNVSSVVLNLAGSAYEGAIANHGTVKVALDAGSTWTLTGDSYVTSLDNNGGTINLNGHTLYVNGEAYTG